MNFSLDTLNPRERQMVTIGGIVAVFLLVVAVVVPLNQSVARAHERVADKQSDLAWMRQVTPELAGAGPVGAQLASKDSLLVVIDRAAREAGLGNSLTSSEPSGAGGLRVRLDKASFDTMVAWIARLAERHGVRVESATVDGAGEPGVVNAALVLRIG